MEIKIATHKDGEWWTSEHSYKNRKILIKSKESYGIKAHAFEENSDKVCFTKRYYFMERDVLLQKVKDRIDLENERAEKVEDSKCPESIWDKWEKEELKVEDSGSEADFGTKDKQESWEDEIGDVLYECCSSPYHDIAFEKIDPIIKSLLETEKKKAVEEVLEYVNKENWHYVDYEKLKAKYKKG